MEQIRLELFSEVILLYMQNGSI